MVREIPTKGKSAARCVIYICVLKGLFDHITIGNAGISWADVEKATAERPKVVASQIVQNEVSLED